MNPTVPEHLQGTMQGFSSVFSELQQKRQDPGLGEEESRVMTGFASFSSY
jgi:hypothetical protein